MLKNDEELLGMREGEGSHLKACYLTRLWATLLKTPTFPSVSQLLGGKKAPFVYLPSPFFLNSLEFFLQGVCVTQRQKTAASQGTKKKIDNRRGGR
jgi:hypothetical protein